MLTMTSWEMSSHNEHKNDRFCRTPHGFQGPVVDGESFVIHSRKLGSMLIARGELSVTSRLDRKPSMHPSKGYDIGLSCTTLYEHRQPDEPPNKSEPKSGRIYCNNEGLVHCGSSSHRSLSPYRFSLSDRFFCL